MNVDINGVVIVLVLSAVDTSEAGIGDVDVTVTCSSGHVAVKRQKLDEFRQKFTFVPSLAVNHDVNVTFNKQQVAGKPYTRRAVLITCSTDFNFKSFYVFLCVYVAASC